MLLASTLAGPGPKTLTYRLKLALHRFSLTKQQIRSSGTTTSRKPGHHGQKFAVGREPGKRIPGFPLRQSPRSVPVTGLRPRGANTTAESALGNVPRTSHQSSIKSTVTSERRNLREPPLNGQKKTLPSATPVTASPTISAVDSSTQSPSVIDDQSDVIFLPPPHDPAFFQPLLKSLSDLCREREAMRFWGALSEITSIWDTLRSTGFDSEAQDEHYEMISGFIAHHMKKLQHYPKDVHRFAMGDSLQFGLLREMAIQAAGRDYWQGLWRFCLVLLASGRASAIPDTYASYKALLRKVQGRSAADAFSWDRETRLAARLEGHGLLPLTTVNIAALTILKQFDGSVIIGMLDSAVDTKALHYSDFPEIQKALKMLKQGGQPFSDFQQSLENFLFSVSVHHPSALRDRLLTLGRAKNKDEISRIYRQLLEGSIGPNRFLHARDLDENTIGQRFSVVPIDWQVWRTFIRCFVWTQQSDMIIKLIQVDIPQRGLTPNADILSQAMVALAKLSSHHKAQSTFVEQNTSRRVANQIWEKIVENGWGEGDAVLSRRLGMLMAFKDWSRLREYHRQALEGHLGLVGPLTQTALINYLLYSDLTDEALETLRLSLAGSVLAPPTERVFHIFLRDLASSPIAVSVKKQCLTEVEKLLPPDIVFDAGTAGIWTALQVELYGGRSERASTYLQYLRQLGDQTGFGGWRAAITALLTRFHGPTVASGDGIAMALEVLRSFADEDKLYLTPVRLTLLCYEIIQQTASSTKINAAERREYLDQVLEIYQLRFGHKPRNVIFRIITKSLNRRDGKGLAEAIHRWGQFRGLYYPAAWWWRDMLRHLDRPEYETVAIDLVKDAFDEKAVALDEEFWLDAMRMGIVRKAGVEENLREWRQSGGRAVMRRVISTEELVEPETEPDTATLDDGDESLNEGADES